MTRRLLFVLLGVSLGSGCVGEMRLAQMTPALERSVRAGRMDEALRTEARLLEIADRTHGPRSVETVRLRMSLAMQYAQWKLTDRALALARETVRQLDPAAADQAIVPALVGLADVQLHAHLWAEAEATTDRLVDLCRAAPAHVASEEDPYDECHFARFEIDDLYLAAGAVEKFAHEYVGRDDPRAEDRDSGLARLTVLGRGYARYGAYPEAAWYLQRCVDESLSRYERSQAPPAQRHVAETPNGDVDVFTMDGAHSFSSQAPRCLEDLVRIRSLVGDERATVLARSQRELWRKGPDLEARLVANMRKSDRTWHDGYNTSHDANDLAFYYAGKGRPRDAIRLYNEAIALVDAQYARDGDFGELRPVGLLLDELLGLGAACEETGFGAEAAAAYARAVELADRELHPRHAWRLASRAGLARSLSASGRREDAVAAWHEYSSTAQAIRGPNHPDLAVGLDGLASATESVDRRAARLLRARAEKIRADARSRIDAIHELPLPVALRSSAPPAN